MTQQNLPYALPGFDVLLTPLLRVLSILARNANVPWVITKRTAIAGSRMP